MDKWDMVFQDGSNQAYNWDTGEIYKIEILNSTQEAIRGRLTDVEYLHLTDAAGKVHRCWRRKSPENNYAICLIE